MPELSVQDFQEFLRSYRQLGSIGSYAKRVICISHFDAANCEDLRKNFELFQTAYKVCEDFIERRHSEFFERLNEKGEPAGKYAYTLFETIEDDLIRAKVHLRNIDEVLMREVKFLAKRG